MSVEEVVGFATLTGLVLAGIDWLLRLWFRRRGSRSLTAPLLKKVEQLHQQLDQAREERRQVSEERDGALRQVDRVGGELIAARKERDEARQERDAARSEVEQAQAGLAVTQGEQEELRRQRRSLDRRVRQALSLGGQIWAQGAMKDVPRFQPLKDRCTPIVSLLNLKGGVGKTTLTAYLAWGLAHRNYRVLLVDLDLQGSLSSLFIAQRQLAERDEAALNLRHFLEAAAHKPRTRLKGYVCRLPIGKGCALVGTTDKHAYAEMNLTFQWLLRTGHAKRQWDGRRDARFLLRRGLHARTLLRKFDIVLLDCPPIINLSCVNALAASDYVLIPATCSRKATERVPPLIRRLKELHSTINPALQVMGLVANRTRGGEERNSVEQTLWNALTRHAQDELGLEVYSFRQPVPDRAQIRDAEDSFAPPPEGSDVFNAFVALAEEFEGRLPSECRRPAAVPQQPR
jgi:cellulose biosynthesis protein BcsQ